MKYISFKKTGYANEKKNIYIFIFIPHKGVNCYTTVYVQREINDHIYAMQYVTYMKLAVETPCLLVHDLENNQNHRGREKKF
jgi:hypothetical protein